MVVCLAVIVLLCLFFSALRLLSFWGGQGVFKHKNTSFLYRNKKNFVSKLSIYAFLFFLGLVNSYSQLKVCSTNKVTNGIFLNNFDGWDFGFTDWYYFNESMRIDRRGTSFFYSESLNLCDNSSKQVKFYFRQTGIATSYLIVKLGGQPVFRADMDGIFTFTYQGLNGAIVNRSGDTYTVDITNFSAVAPLDDIEFEYYREQFAQSRLVVIDNVEVYETIQKPANPTQSTLNYCTGGNADLTSTEPTAISGATYEWHTVASNPSSSTAVTTPDAVTSGTYYLYARSNCDTNCISDVADVSVTVSEITCGTPSAPSSWNCGCDKRKKITLSNAGIALNQYQIRVNVAYDTDMTADFSDIRFTTANGTTEIPYWIETYQASTSAIIWVKVPTITANTTTDIYMYYGGCSSTGNTSNATNVFEFFDDMNTMAGWTNINIGGPTNLAATTFAGASVLRRQNQCDPRGGWKSLGTTLNSFRLITRERREVGSSGCGLNRYGVENSNFNGYNIKRDADKTSGNRNFGFESRSNGVGGTGANFRRTTLPQPRANWYRTELRRCQTGNSNQAILYNDDRTEIGSISGSISYNYLDFDRVTIRGGRIYYVDFMAVAKYTCNEPTVSIGAEETNEVSATLLGTTTICSGETTTLTVELTGTSTWSITYTDGTNQTTIGNINTTTYTFAVSPTTTTTYNLTSVSGALCSGTVSGTAVITVNSLPDNVSSNGFKGKIICQGEPTRITYNARNTAFTAPHILTYTDGTNTYTQTIATASSVEFDTPYTITQTTTFTLLSIEDGNGCVNSGTTITKRIARFTLRTPPSCSITGSNVPVCPESVETYTANTGMTSYSWSVTGATISGVTNSNVVDVIAGSNGSTYTVTLTVEGANGCTSSCTKTVTVSDTTAPTFTVPTPFEFCVENIMQATYHAPTTDITPNRPEYYNFKSGSTVLDLNESSFADNCCVGTGAQISLTWTINFDGGTPSAITGTGQPSTYGSDIQLVGDGVNFTDKVHNITYYLNDCSGNTTSTTVNITIKPRPRITKQN